MNKSSGISYLKPEHRLASKQSDSARAAIDSIKRVVCEELSALVQSMFDGIDDSLFELANNARTNNEQNRYFEAMREIRIKRKGIETNFIQSVHASFTTERVLSKPQDARDTANAKQTDSLALIHNEELEEEVAINGMATKTQANFQGPLLQFQTRIANLYGCANPEDITPPLNPKSLCKAFAQSCNSLEIEIQERLIVFKQFDRYVMSNFEQVIVQPNKILIRHGIMPNLKTPGVRQKVHPRSQTASSPLPRAESKAAASTDTAIIQSDSSPSLQTLLNSVRTAQNQTARQNTSLNHPSRPQSNDSDSLLGILNRIQKDYTEQLSRGYSSQAIDIRSVIAEESNHKNSPTFKQVDEDLINLVAMLFEFILEDYNLAPSIQALLGRLQIPILKVVIKDKSFFSSSRHPARQLLNSLARSGIGWAESQDTSKDKLYERMHQTVYRVLQEFDGDITLFKTLNRDFHEFIEREQRKASIVEQRTQEAEKGRIKSKQAQQKVEKLLSNKILNAHYPIPQLLIDTIKNGWSRVMFLAYLKDEQEHQWHNTVKLVDDLIWCVQPLTEQTDRQKWIKVVPKLLKDLKSGLAAVSYKSSSLEETIKEIQDILTESFRNSADTPIALKPMPHQPEVNEHEAEKYTEANDDYAEELELVKQLRIGTWLEFKQANGSKIRCKLSTKIDEADCYIFVNRMGLKIIEKTGLELAKDLHEANALVLAQGQIMDRAMSAIMSNLRIKSDSK